MQKSWAGSGALALLVVACGSGQPEPETPASGAVTCPAGQTYDGQFCVAPSTPSATPAATATPRDERPPEPAVTPGEKIADPPAAPAPEETVSTASMAAPVDVAMAASAAPLIQYLASAHLPAGARPFGVPFAGQFTEGQVLEQRVQLSVGKCYTVVGAGTPPVEELKLALHAVPASGTRLPDAVPLASDADRGPQAVLGRKTECFRPSEGQTQLILVLQVEKGRGVAAAQVFEK